jgi:hypothetical protein
MPLKLWRPALSRRPLETSRVRRNGAPAAEAVAAVVEQDRSHPLGPSIRRDS